MSSKRHQSRNHNAPPLLAEHEAPDMAGFDPSPEPRPVARQTAYDVDRIGDILRRVREHRGEDLEAISDYLRIRPNYLVALENSRYEDLPADAYVIGFLRTYSLYLGLDGKGAIDQYRREMAGRRRKPQLTMPQPMSEGRAPTIAVLIGAAIAALLVYGIWYGISSPDTSASTQPVSLSQTEKTEQPESERASSLTAQTATSDGIALSVPVTAVPAITPMPIEPTETNKDAKQAEPAPPVVKEEKDTKPPMDIKPAEPTAKEKTENTPPKELTPSQPKKEIASVNMEAGKSRLMLRAEKESWVLVTDSKGVTIFDKTLQAGETYSVPAGKGLKLTTGNPAGLAFDLDGSTLPKIKTSKDIVRAIPLDPDKIKTRLTDGDAAASDQ